MEDTIKRRFSTVVFQAWRFLSFIVLHVSRGAKFILSHSRLSFQQLPLVFLPIPLEFTFHQDIPNSASWMQWSWKLILDCQARCLTGLQYFVSLLEAPADTFLCAILVFLVVHFPFIDPCLTKCPTMSETLRPLPDISRSLPGMYDIFRDHC